MPELKKELSALLAEAIRRSVPGAAPEVTFEIPREEKFGDLSSSVILRLAKETRQAPRALAERVAGEFGGLLGGSALAGRIGRVSVEGPGFLNFHYTGRQHGAVLERLRAEGALFGAGRPAAAKKILLEFVSANPTGPLTVAHGRQAALGDSLARILRFRGHDVTTEYYNNDEGVQINTLGASLWLRVREQLDGKPAQMPENSYRGEYLVEIARGFIHGMGEARARILSESEGIERCRQHARDVILQGIKKDLADFDVAFDGYYSQETLGKSGKVERTLEDLKTRGVVYESEGAVWLRSTAFGDDKDRVLVKSDKNYTYLTPDIAYHHEKFGRGFDTIIDILGPDHHGYIARLKASQAALGHDPERVNVLIAQLVTLYEGDRQVRMSTRAGEFVTLRQVLDEVGRDAGRFFFLMRKFDAHLDFDLQLAKSQTPDNPVFYIQYAHARIESVKATCRERYPESGANDPACLERLGNPAEVNVMRLLGQFEGALEAAERTLEPYRVVAYLMELAGSFHRFYADNRVAGEDPALMRARLWLADGVQRVLRTGLDLLGVSAPEKM